MKTVKKGENECIMIDKEAIEECILYYFYRTMFGGYRGIFSKVLKCIYGIYEHRNAWL